MIRIVNVTNLLRLSCGEGIHWVVEFEDLGKKVVIVSWVGGFVGEIAVSKECFEDHSIVLVGTVKI